MKQWSLYLVHNLSLFYILFLKTMLLLGHSQRATRGTDLFFPAGIGTADEHRAGTIFHPMGTTCDTLHFLQPVLPTSTPAVCQGRTQHHTQSTCTSQSTDFTWHGPYKTLLSPRREFLLLNNPSCPLQGPKDGAVVKSGFAPKQAAQPAQGEDKGNEAPCWV